MGNDAETMTPMGAAVYVASFAVITWSLTLVPSSWLEALTAQCSSATFAALGHSSSWGVQGGRSFLTLVGEMGPVTVTIIRECTAINVFSVILGLVLPLDGGTVMRKLVSVVLSGVLLFAMNVSRIMLTVFLTGFSTPPFSWFFTDPTVELYHYPISFAYGVIGVALLILILNRYTLPELGDTLVGIPLTLRRLPEYVKNIRKDRPSRSDI